MFLNYLERTSENRSMVVAQYLWTSFVIFGGVFGLEELDLTKIAFFIFGWGKGDGGAPPLIYKGQIFGSKQVLTCFKYVAFLMQ
jgi:hypothetical protein